MNSEFNLVDVAGILGGILLVLGAGTLAQGKARISLILYFFADLCWLTIAMINKSFIGSISIVIGIIFSTIVMYRMQTGEFHTSLKKIGDKE